MSAAAVTLVKLGSTSLGSQHGPLASTDLIFEFVHVTLAETLDWIECGGASPQTQMVRRPVGAIFSATNAEGAAITGEAEGIRLAVSGTKVIFTGDGGTEAAAEFDVIIVGFPA